MEPPEQAATQGDSLDDFLNGDEDILLYSGPVLRYLAEDLFDLIDGIGQKRANVSLILTTYGGVADHAYRIARALKRNYNFFRLYVVGPCKSAGTLLALGADEIVMTARGELGPLDVQVIKTDDVDQVSSGLDIFQSIEEIASQAFRIYESHMLEIKRRSLGSITLSTASDIAIQIASALLSPIAAKIDPNRLGEMRRAIDVATEYGRRLGAEERVLQALTLGYPAHNFVIDAEEAAHLFAEGIVRAPKDVENGLFRNLKTLLLEKEGEDYLAYPHESGLIVHLNTLDATNEVSHDHSQSVRSGSGPKNAGESSSQPEERESDDDPV